MTVSLPDDKDPLSDARCLAKINRYNYLAHTIREIKHEIDCAKRLSYHITVEMTEMRNSASVTFFYRRGSTIYLPSECEQMDGGDLRLIMAHELGHISYAIDSIDSRQGQNESPPDDEECYAWAFARELLKAKSDSYRDGVGIDQYIYGDDDLDRLLMSNLERQQPDRKDMHEWARKYLSDRKAARDKKGANQ